MVPRDLLLLLKEKQWHRMRSRCDGKQLASLNVRDKFRAVLPLQYERTQNALTLHR